MTRRLCRLGEGEGFSAGTLCWGSTVFGSGEDGEILSDGVGEKLKAKGDEGSGCATVIICLDNASKCQRENPL